SLVPINMAYGTVNLIAPEFILRQSLVPINMAYGTVNLIAPKLVLRQSLEPINMAYGTIYFLAHRYLPIWKGVFERYQHHLSRMLQAETTPTQLCYERPK
ncbi:hypothetical protein, partial [Pantoea dispersa]|uniref:hypothetical protein n=2 Tax=Pantoea dispersa TaxID=59814 RepID=UPI003017C3C9